MGITLDPTLTLGSGPQCPEGFIELAQASQYCSFSYIPPRALQSNLDPSSYTDRNSEMYGTFASDSILLWLKTQASVGEAKVF